MLGVEDSRLKKLIFSFAFFCGIVILFFNLKEVKAAEIYFVSSSHDIYPGDVFIVSAKISSPDVAINVAEGAVAFDNDFLELKEIAVGGSVIGLWADGPALSGSESKINFTGGIPEGFKGSDALIFNAIFSAKKEGKAKLEYNNDFSVFLNDGKGTKITPDIRQLTLDIVGRPTGVSQKDDWSEIKRADTTGPKFEEAIISKDPRAFEGKYFISFYAIDNESGTSYYEINEGNRGYMRAVSPFVLSDQTLKVTIQIKAVDSAGNETIITPIASVVRAADSVKLIVWTIVVLIILVVVIFVLRRIRK